MSFFLAFLAVGTAAGLTYALLALGMVLIYKGTRILNFAQPFFGSLAAFLCWWMTSRATFPPFSWLPFELDSRPRFILAAVISLALVGLNGWSIEHNLIRRMHRAPRLVLLVLTIAIGLGTLGLINLLFFRTEQAATTFRRLPSLWKARVSIGQAVITGDHLVVMIVTLLIAASAWYFFTRTKFGVAVRASAENVEAARLLGISAHRVSSFAWVAGSVLAGIAGILIVPIVGILDIGTLSTGFLVRGLTAALVGGLTSIPGAVVGGLAVGISEFMIKWQFPDRPGPPETLMFAAVILVLIFRPGGLFGQREETEDQVAFIPTLRELPARLKNSIAAKGVRFFAVVPVIVLLLVSFSSGAFVNGILVQTIAFAMVGVSLTVLMGYTGQISLGHWGLAGVGAFGLANLYTRLELPYLLALPLTIVIGMIVSLIIGLPALRIRGLYLAVVTLSFNLAVEIYAFNRPEIGGTSAGIAVSPPRIGPLDLDDPSNRPTLIFSLLMLGLCLLVARNLARSRTGRSFFAMRENEKAAATFGVDLTRYKLLSFAISGGIAALAGALFVTYLEFAEATTWITANSLLVVSMVMIGGIGSTSGSILGAFLVIALPRLIRFDNPWIVNIGTGVLLLIVIVRLRGGLAGMVNFLRERIVVGLDALSQPLPTRTTAGSQQPPATATPAPASSDRTASETKPAKQTGG